MSLNRVPNTVSSVFCPRKRGELANPNPLTHIVIYPLPVNTHSADYEMLLFPVIARMEFDTKERYKFFCCSRERACGIGSGPRLGHSALRPCTPHSGRTDLSRKRRVARCSTCPDEEREAAADSLARRGIHPTRECTALTGLSNAVIHWPDRIYFGLFTYDVMHCVYINCIGYLLDTLIDLMTPTTLMELDARGKKLPLFRRKDGTTCKRARKLSSSAYLTAEMKVRAPNIYIQHIYSCTQHIFPTYIFLHPMSD